MSKFSSLSILGALSGIAISGFTTAASAVSPVAETVYGLSSPGPEGPGKGPLIAAPGGALVGTAEQGGANSLGALFSVTSTGVISTTYSFTGLGDGLRPGWGMARDTAGNLYGASNGNRGYIFKLSKTGVFSVLHTFAADGSEGGIADNGVILGADGRLYGFTSNYGTANGGTFFSLKTNGSDFRIVVNFPPNGPGIGRNPDAAPTQGPDGAFYGVATEATDLNGNSLAWGIIRITSAGSMSLIPGIQSDSVEAPAGKLTMDLLGNMYAVAGARNSVQTGRIYRISPMGSITVLHQFTFTEGRPGGYNQCLLLAKDGRLYGSASNGGANGTDLADGIGTLYTLATDGSGFAVLHNFGDFPGDGLEPEACPTEGSDGSLWGTTFNSSAAGAWGTIYQLAKPTVMLTIRPNPVAVGGKATLKWTSQNAVACTVGGPGVATSGLSGSVPVPTGAAGSFNYSATCNGAGSASKTVALTVQ